MDAGHAAMPEIALSAEDREALRRAVLALEGPSYVARLSALAGRPIELLGQALPVPVSDMISKATQAALTRALRYALKTIPKEGKDPETRAHKALAVLSGAMGGALGVSAVLVELPISTTIMLRSIARIAQHRSSRKTLTRTPVGPITVDCDVLTVPGSDLRIVVYTAVPGSEDASRLDLLRVTGLQPLEAADVP